MRHVTYVDPDRATGKPDDAFYATTRTLPTDVYLPRSSAPAATAPITSYG